MELTDWLLSLFSWIEALKSNASIDGGFDALDMWRALTADLDINHNRYDVDADISPLVEGVVALSKMRAALFAGQISQFEPITQLTQLANFARFGDEWESALDQNQIELPDLPEETVLLIQSYLALTILVAGGRRLGMTESGMMALLPGDAQNGDHLAIILGAPDSDCAPRDR
jgi:hypothetical protein